MGASYIATDELSAHRPDAAMAHVSDKIGAADEDCLHSCMPGPVDTWSRLLYNLMRSWRDAADAGAAAEPPAARGGRGFFSMPRDTWLGSRGASTALEQCHGRRGPGACVEASVAKMWWWPFANCSKAARLRSAPPADAASVVAEAPPAARLRQRGSVRKSARVRAGTRA